MLLRPRANIAGPDSAPDSRAAAKLPLLLPSSGLWCPSVPGAECRGGGHLFGWAKPRKEKRHLLGVIMTTGTNQSLKNLTPHLGAEVTLGRD